MNSCCRTRIRTSTNWTKTSCAAITPYDSPPKRVCKYTFFYFCTNTQAKKYARLIKKLEFEGSKLLNHLYHTNAKQCFTRHCFTDKRFVRNDYFTRFIMVMPNSYSKEIGLYSKNKLITTNIVDIVPSSTNITKRETKKKLISSINRKGNISQKKIFFLSFFNS